MSESKLTQGNVEAVENKAPQITWRQAVLGAGVFLLVVSLFISAGAKGALGSLPAVVAGLGCALIVVSGVAGVLDWLSSKKGGGKQASG